jgi:hypothetical protein
MPVPNSKLCCDFAIFLVKPDFGHEQDGQAVWCQSVGQTVASSSHSLSLSCPLCQHREDNGITKLIQLLFVEIKEVCEFAVGVHERQLMLGYDSGPMGIPDVQLISWGAKPSHPPTLPVCELFSI